MTNTSFPAAQVAELVFAGGPGAGNAEDLSIGIDVLCKASPHHNTRLGSSGRQMTGEAIGRGDIVGVHAGDPGTRGRLDPAVHRRADAGMFLANDADTGVRFCVPLKHRERVIRRAVVDRQNLKVGKCLREQAVHRLREERCALKMGMMTLITPPHPLSLRRPPGQSTRPARCRYRGDDPLHGRHTCAEA